MYESTRHCIARVARMSTLALALVVLLWLALTRALPARAGGVVTTCDEPSLRAALAGGGLVTFNCAGSPVITLSSQIVITADASIDGADNGSPVTLSGNNMTSIFVITASHMLTLSDITIRNGSGPGAGCIEVAPGSNLYAGQTTLTNCHGDLKGGLWIANDASATLVDSRVLSNSSNEHSGGISVDMTGTLTLSNSLLAYNHNDHCPVDCSGNPWERAGGIVNSGTITLSHVMVTGNVEDGIANLGKATLTSVAFTGNTGSAIRNFGTAMLSDVTVSDTVYSYPGIVNYGMAMLNNSMISHSAGGGIFNLGTLTLTNVTINDNLNWGCMRGNICGGGGIEMWGGTATLINVTLSGNFAAGYGGAIFIAGGTATLLNVTVFNNAATFGSIYISHQPY